MYVAEEETLGHASKKLPTKQPPDAEILAKPPNRFILLFLPRQRYAKYFDYAEKGLKKRKSFSHVVLFRNIQQET